MQTPHVITVEFEESDDVWTATLLQPDGRVVSTPEPCEDLPTALEYLAHYIARDHAEAML